MAESDLVYIAVQFLATVRDDTAPTDLDTISLDTTRTSDKAIEPRSSRWFHVPPLMCRAGPSAPCRKGICEAEKTRSTCKKTCKLNQRLTRFEVATERCRNSCESAIRCRFLPPTGQPKGYHSCSLRTATCPQNNRQPVNSLETDRFEHVDIIMINQYIMLIVTFFGYFCYGDSLHDLLKASGFDACAKNTRPASRS